MIKKKLNVGFYLFIIFFSAVIFIGSRAVTMMFSGEVTYEDNAAIPKAEAHLISTLLGIVILSYAVTVITMIIQAIRRKNNAFYIDECGIHNTFVIINLLAFLFIGNVKFIPWSAVKSLDTEDGAFQIRVNKNEIEASKFAKLIISIMGYGFCAGFSKPKLSDEEKELIRGYIISEKVDIEV